MRSGPGAGAIGAATWPPPSPPGDAAAAPGTAAGFLMAALAGVLLLSVLAGIRVSRPGTGGADIHVSPDDDVAVVLCVVDAAGQGRCFGKDGVLAGALDGRSPALCGLADRPLASPCPGGGACAFRQVAVPSDAFGLVLLEPRPPLFGVPRHRLIDAAVLAPDAPVAAPQIAAGVQRLARCFAPSAPPPVEVDLVRRACEPGPCRLHHSSVRVAVHRTAPAANR